jgi:hypothetical protein
VFIYRNAALEFTRVQVLPYIPKVIVPKAGAQTLLT